MDTRKIGYIICESGLVPVTDAPETKIVNEDTVEYIDDNGEKKLSRRVIADTVLQTADLKNRNGRIYPGSELFPQLESERIQTLLNHGQLCGEAGHPLEATLVRQQTIDPKLTMSRYLKLWSDGQFVWGRYKGTNNEYGKALDMDLREGYIPEFSLRALGTVDNTPQGAIVRNLKMITYDVVHYQSDPNAYTRKIVTESSTNGDYVHDRRLLAIKESAKEFGNEIIVKESVLEPIMSQDVMDYLMQESTNLQAIKDSFDICHDSIKYLPDIDKVRLMDKEGNTLMINLESYLSNEMINYAMRKR